MPIEEKDVLTALSRAGREGLSLKAILKRMGHRGGDAKVLRKELRALLRELMHAGRVERLQDGYRASRRDGLVEGWFTPDADAGARSDHGTVVDEGGGSWEVETALPVEAGQRVLLEPVPGRPGRGEVVARDAAERDHWVGVFDSRGKGGVVHPYRDDARWRVRIAKGDVGGARDGEVVVVEPLHRKKRSDPRFEEAKGRVVECLGWPGEAEADFRAVAWRRQLPLVFPSDVLEEAEAIPAKLDAKELAARVDLRGRPFVTIDPADAKDHDDAVCVEEEGDEIRLWVAIADVSHYVRAGSAMDREALRRGNSVYFPKRVVPMLPERISNQLCSLRPDEDRFAMVVELCIDVAGAVRRSSFYPAVIRSRARLSYEVAAASMTGQGKQLEKAAALAPEIRDQLGVLARLTQRLSKRRFEAGSIDFDLPESRIVIGGDGRPASIEVVERMVAHRAVEEAMLAANLAVGRLLTRSKIPSIYRIHETPDPAKLEALRDLLETFDLLGKGGARKAGAVMDSREIERALRRAAGHPEERLVNMVALRSMKQARYSALDQGHFALGFESYLHFTSPIRRYADLVVHRKLRDWLAHAPVKSSEGERLERVALRISYRERVAVDCEREIMDLAACAFMAQHVGEEFSGTISGVAVHGIYVTLDAFPVDGLVRRVELGSDLEFDQAHHVLAGRRSGRRFRLGDAVRIRVVDVNQLRGWINFVLVDGESEPGRDPSKGRRREAHGDPDEKKGKGRDVRRGRRSGPRARPRGAPNRRRGRR